MYIKEEELLDFYNSLPTGGQVTSKDKLVRTLEALGVEMKGDVLDLGCAQGHTCKFAKMLGAKSAFGVDFSKERIAIAKKNNPGIEFLATDMHYFVDTTNLTFDIIMLFDAIEHLEDSKALIENAKEILNPGGKIISSTPLRMPYKSHIQVFETLDEFVTKLSPTKAIEDGKSALALWAK